MLGNFEGARFEHHGQRTEFLRQGGRYLVRTQGADGRTRDFEATHVLGVYPLQQLLIALPGGRLQAFGVAWDAQPRAEGGQRWYALYPEEPPAPGEALHWSGRDQNANFMCLGCHATGYRKGYDEAADAYRSTQAELGVGCEACHGPGSAHRDWVRAGRPPDAAKGFGAPLSRLRRAVFAFLPGAAIARAQGPVSDGQAASEACLGCHARRSQLVDEAGPQAPFLDQFSPSLIAEGLYHADGRIDGEVFEYGSFAQSAMHAAGVGCGNCHDAHSLKPHAPGDALCSQCHQPAAYAGPAHAPAAGAGRGCVDCHMPAKTYMGVHVRHDHSLRRPGAAARAQSPFVQASRLAEDADATTLARAARSEDALVRLGAARGLSRLAPRAAVALGRPLLSDARRAVRIEAARALVGLPWPEADAQGRQALQRATAELLRAERESAERPQAQLNLAAIHVRLGETEQAQAALRRALWLDPNFVPAQLNLADLLRRLGRDAEAEPLLRQAAAASPHDGVPAHALGLWLVRHARLPEALAWLRRAWDTTPRAPHAQAYALALAESGQARAGVQVLEQALEKMPADTVILRSLIALEQRLGLHEAARAHARQLQLGTGSGP